jgi:hypothetical protein
VGGGVFAVKSFSTLLSFVSDARVTPVTFRVHCETGTYDVFQQGTTSQGRSVLPSDVTVTGPGGQRVAANSPGTSETRTIDGESYANVVSFDTPVAGVYRVRVDPEGQHVAVIVAPSLGTAVRHNLGWLFVCLLGIVPFLLGVTMVIVRAVQRTRRRTRAPGWQRCENGHLVAPTDRFCAACGAPVYPAGSMVRQP